MRKSSVFLVILGALAAVVIALSVSMTPAYTFSADGTMICPVCQSN